MKEPTTENNDFQDILDDIESENYTEIIARIYRRDKNDNTTIGRPPTGEFLQKVNFKVDDSYLAETFGPGFYTVKYRLKKDGEKPRDTQNKFTISQDVVTSRTSPKQAAPQMAGAYGDGLLQAGAKFLNGLTLDKLTMIGAAIKGFRDFIAPPPPPPVDFVKLLEVFGNMAQKPQTPTISETIVSQALLGMQKQQQGPDIFKQIEMIDKLKELVRKDETTQQTGDTMEYIKLAMQFLPQLLQKQKGDFTAVGRQARENALIKNLIADNPDLTRQFMTAAVEKYGPENAGKLAAGFGYKAKFVPGMNPEQSEEKTEEETEEETPESEDLENGEQ